jgi:nucleoside-diphosphate-sugar epimerase
MLRTELLITDGKASIEQIDISELNGKTILITGASGIIGTDLLYGLFYLITEKGANIKVKALVNRGIPDHFSPMIKTSRIEFLVGDLTNFTFLNSIPKADLIIHAATYGQPGKFMEHPEITIKLNTTVTLHLLENVLNEGGKFLFISTSEVYSGLTISPFNEKQIGTTDPLHPRACYIESKRCGETIVNTFRLKGVHAVSARLSLAYGPGTRMDDKRVLNNFIEKAIKNGEIRLMDRGSALRTYCYVTDAVNMMWQILLKGSEAVYNIGGDSRLSIFELAKLVGSITTVDVITPEEQTNSLTGSPEDVRLDISRYVAEFGSPTFVDMETGLKRTIEWQKEMFSEI